MSQKLTNSIVEKMSVGSKLYQISDVMLPNFSVRVHPSGNKVYYVRCGQRNIKIGNATVLTTIKAREIARDMLALVAQGIDPVKKTPTQTAHIPNDMQLRTFIDDYYTPWVKVNRKSASQTLKLIQFRFKTFMEQQIGELRIYDFEQTRTEQQSKGIKRSSINRGETALKAALNWGVHVGILDKNPLERMRRLKETDSETIVCTTSGLV